MPSRSPVANNRQRDRYDRLGRMGVSLLTLGLVLHFAVVLLRGLAVHRPPWANMYEFVMVACFVAVATWHVMLRKFPIRHLSAFVLLPVVILMFLGGTALYAVAAPVEPALQSYWLIIHVAAIIVASGLLLVPGVASVLYLIRCRHDRDPTKIATLRTRLPNNEVLDRIAYRVTVLTFPLFTFAVICGAIRAEAAWGSYWGWDPKETVAFIAGASMQFATRCSPLRSIRTGRAHESARSHATCPSTRSVSVRSQHN